MDFLSLMQGNTEMRQELEKCLFFSVAAIAVAVAIVALGVIQLVWFAHSVETVFFVIKALLVLLWAVLVIKAFRHFKNAYL
jgi:hypothetical protein